jgi:1,4-alpha-glucan branching enzyme
VHVAGDFNGWSTESAPMMRLPGTNVWTVTVPVKPGRHVYSYVVDGTRWIADPRAPRATDSDFGRPGSVVIVQVP